MTEEKKNANRLSGGPENESGLTRASFLRRSALAGGAALGAGALLAGCGSGEQQASQQNGGSSGDIFPGNEEYAEAVRNVVNGKTLTIGFSPPALSEFYDEIEHGAWYQMSQYEEKFGIQWDWTRAAPQEHEQVAAQQDIIQDWATKEFDAALICTAGDFASMQRVYSNAMDQGMAIFQFNMPIELWDISEINAVSNIGYDNARQAGYIAGQYIAQRLNGQGQVLLVWGLPTHWAESRENGLRRALEEYPDIEIVGKQRGDYVREQGMNAAQTLLERFPDANAIYGENEEMALGAAQAAQAQGLQVMGEDGEGVLIIGADGLASGYQDIQAGRLTATVDVGPVEQGRFSIINIFHNLMLGYTVDTVTNVPTNVIDASNVEPILAYVNWALEGPEY